MVPELLPILSVLLIGLGTGLLLPHRHGKVRPRVYHVVGALIAAGGIGLFLLLISPSADWVARLHLYAFAALAIAAAILTVTARDPVHNALWFSIVLLATSGLFLLVGAQFLAAGTVIVYAGAIVVTFLFVIMLAQAEGQALYDRMARAPLRSALTAFGLLLGLVYAIWRTQTSVYRDMQIPQAAAPAARTGGGPAGGPPGPGPGPGTPAKKSVILQKHDLSATDFEQRLVRTSDLLNRAIDPLKGTPLRAIAANENSDEVLSVLQRVLSPTNTQVVGSSEEAGRGVPPPHVAGLGGTLFTDHLVTVEVAGAILFVALVGAVSIATPRALTRAEPPDRA